MSYREHPPPASLRPWLGCMWERVADDGPPVRVVPDGCCDILWIEGAGTLLVGANTTAFLVALAPGTRVVGARMRPGAAPALLGIDAAAVRDARVPLEQIWGDSGRRLAAALDEREHRVGVLLAELKARAEAAPVPDQLVGAAIARLEHPHVSVSELADELAVSERQLRRRFASAVGYGPKRLARVLRLSRALSAAAHDADLCGVAFDAGYADQAHFTNDCRALAGVPPAALLGR